MGVDNFLSAKVEGQRQAKRARVLLSAKLKTAWGEVDCRLRDLSRKGALVECRPAPPTGTPVIFTRGPISVPARVAWSQPGRVGLEFDYMIDEHDVMVQLKPVAASASEFAAVPVATHMAATSRSNRSENARLRLWLSASPS